jgi:hydrogenase maturation protease
MLNVEQSRGAAGSANAPFPPPVLVLGLGNILLQDEGVGVRVVERLQREYELSPQVDVLDGGTAGMALYDDIIGRRHLIVVDAVNAGKPPGTVVTLTGGQVPALFRNKVSPHQMALSDVLAALEIMGEKPAGVTVIGVQPKDLGTGLELSPLIAGRVATLLAGVVQALSDLGYSPRKREA